MTRNFHQKMRLSASIQKRYYDPQIIAGFIVGFCTFVPALTTCFVLHKTSKDRDQISDDIKKHYKEVHIWQKQVMEQDDNWRKQAKYENDINILDKDLNETKKQILEILYGDTHRHISDNMAHLISKLQSNNKNYDAVTTEENYKEYYNENRKIAEDWYKDFKKKIDENISVEEKRKSPIYQINMARSAVRDNFSQLSSLLTNYSATLNRRNNISTKLDNLELRPALLTFDEAKGLLDRYDRFVRHTKPFDQVMGYLKNDGFIYKHGEEDKNYPIFFEKVKSNLSETDKTKLVNFFNTSLKKTIKNTSG